MDRTNWTDCYLSSKEGMAHFQQFYNKQERKVPKFRSSNRNSNVKPKPEKNSLQSEDGHRRYETPNNNKSRRKIQWQTIGNKTVHHGEYKNKDSYLCSRDSNGKEFSRPRQKNTNRSNIPRKAKIWSVEETVASNDNAYRNNQPNQHKRTQYYHNHYQQHHPNNHSLNKHKSDSPQYVDTAIPGIDCQRPKFERGTGEGRMEGLLSQTSTNIANGAEPKQQRNGCQRCCCSALKNKRRVILAIIIPIICGIFLVLSFTLNAMLFGKEKHTAPIFPEQDMIAAKINLTIINRDYTVQMSNPLSKDFRRIAEPLCKELNDLYVMGKLRELFVICSINKLRNGTVVVAAVVLLFETSDRISKQRILSVLEEAQSHGTIGDYKYIRLGEFLVLMGCLKLTLEVVTVDKSHYPKIQSLNNMTLSRKDDPRKQCADSAMIPPSEMNVPEEIIDNKILKKTIRCVYQGIRSYDVVVTWKIRSEDELTYGVLNGSDVHQELTRTTHNCINVTEGFISFIPKMARNGSSVLCLLVNQTSQKVLAAMNRTILVLPDTECGPLKYQMIPHPYHFGLYLKCRDTDFTVLPCPPPFSFKTITQKCESPEFPNTEVTMVQEMHSTTDLKLVCSVTNYTGWVRITLVKKSELNQTLRMVEVSSQNAVEYINSDLRSRLGIDFNVTQNSMVLNTRLKRVTCHDQGVFYCWTETPRTVHSKSLVVKFKGQVFQPVITLPIEMVDNRALRHPITCSVIFHNRFGYVQWSIQTEGENQFRIQVSNITEQKTVSATKCSINVTRFLDFKPTITSNRAVFRCEVLDSQSKSYNPKIVSEYIITVLLANHCANLESNKNYKHPYDSHKYIECQNDFDFQVKQCPSNLTFNPDTERCGDIGVSINDEDGWLQEDVVSMECRLKHLGIWHSLSISRVDFEGKSTQLVNATSDNEVHNLVGANSGRFYAKLKKVSKKEVHLTVWIYQVSCEDEGRYVCMADVPFELKEATAYLKVKAFAKSPTITVPMEIIEHKSPRQPFQCESNVGNMGGEISWKIKRTNDTDFHTLPYRVSTKTTIGNCSKLVKSTFTFIPTISDDEMLVRCEVSSITNQKSRQDVPLDDIYRIHVIPANFCGQKTDNILQHPNYCRLYIRCTPGDLFVQKCTDEMCFNPSTLQCDTPERSLIKTVDPDFPCKPNRNGVFFPHPFICNRYYWCVHGEEVEQVCQMGSLYWRNGRCTFDDQFAHCFQHGDYK